NAVQDVMLSIRKQIERREGGGKRDPVRNRDLVEEPPSAMTAISREADSHKREEVPEDDRIQNGDGEIRPPPQTQRGTRLASRDYPLEQREDNDDAEIIDGIRLRRQFQKPVHRPVKFVRQFPVTSSAAGLWRSERPPSAVRDPSRRRCRR